MTVLHDFECVAHGYFEARAKAGTVPKCPKGCSRALVKQVFLQAPGHVSARTRSSDRLVREMAAAQGLSDLSTSPSRPGGTVMQRLRQKYGQHIQPQQMPRAVDASQYIGALTHRANELANLGFAAPYRKDEWKKNDETGKVVHVGAQAPHPGFMPRASVEYLKTDPRSRARAQASGKR